MAGWAGLSWLGWLAGLACLGWAGLTLLDWLVYLSGWAAWGLATGAKAGAENMIGTIGSRRELRQVDIAREVRAQHGSTEIQRIDVGSPKRFKVGQRLTHPDDRIILAVIRYRELSITLIEVEIATPVARNLQPDRRINVPKSIQLGL